MLILSRKQAERIVLGEDIVLTIVSVGNDKVRIGVEAPPGIRILRTELEIRDATIPYPSSVSNQKIAATSDGTGLRIRRAA